MGKVTEFLLRWLYLANLIDDRIDIQNLPHPHAQGPMMTGQGVSATEGRVPGLSPQRPPLSQASSHMNPQTMGSYVPTNSIQSKTILADRRNHIENEWKQNCLRGLAMYPPGTPRRLALDSLRVEIVHNLASQLRRADELLRKRMTKMKKSDIQPSSMLNNIVSGSGNDRYGDDKSNGVKIDSRHSERSEQSIVLDLANPESSSSPDKRPAPNDTQRSVTEEEEYDDEQTLDDSLLDADIEIVEALRLVTEGETHASNNDNIENTDSHCQSSNFKTGYDQNYNSPSNEEVLEAQALLMEAREYLPQLVSVVLHSKPPLTPQPSLHPKRSMRKLLIARCMEDPSLGIELCWLLEAEVGRAWKSLFEHRQQTGRRLIVVLPAEKARVISKIGTEKKAAFDLLQDAEQATAYGSTVATSIHHSDNVHNQYLHHHPSTSGGDNDPDYAFPLPAAISLKRCSHFGDTMHFIDSLTQISLDLRLIPNLERNAQLQQRLDELNRRLRRRMVTRGAVSIDVEDSLTHEDWPHLSDVTLDMLRYSVHLPLEPKSIVWEGGDDHPSFINSTASTSSNQKIKTGVMRVLNIVAHDCRLLASRERCPFLVQVEVAETGLEGSDARLYAGGGVDAGESSRGNNNLQSGAFGVSLEEVIRLFASSKKKMQNERRMQNNGKDHVSGKLHEEEHFASYRLPHELLSNDVAFISKSNTQKDYTTTNPIEAPTTATTNTSYSSDAKNSSESINTPDIELPRGGGQYPEEEGFYVPDTEYGNGMVDENYGMYNNEILRQQQIQKLHDQMLSERLQQQNHVGIPQAYTQNQGMPYAQQVTHKIKSELLDSVFGVSWKKKSEQIRLSSPYGKVKGWRLASFIMKAGEDIRREALVMQVISKLKSWFDEEIPSNQRPYLRPYSIMCVGGDAGLLECLPDAKSVDEIKKQTDDFSTLRDYFERAYGPPSRQNNLQQPHNYPNVVSGVSGSTIPQPPFSQQYQYNAQPQPPTQNIPPPPPQSTNSDHSADNSITFEQAQDNFLRSLVGYSLVCFILQIKDRHNANILMDREGHLLHIDFGFVLGDTPKMGKVPLFSERAPFKLTTEFWDVIGGWNVNEGGQGVRFCKMFEAAFACASAHAEELASLVEAAVLNLTSNGARARLLANGLRQRLKMRGPKDSAEQKQFIMDLVDASLSSWGTSTYDWLQKSMNGYQ